jgi:hypothetical protein
MARGRRSTPDQADETVDTGGQMWDAPNQQVVREDASHPSEEGTGGQEGTTETTVEEETPPAAEESEGE